MTRKAEKKTVVVALGGNAITQAFEYGNIHEQFANTRRSLEGVAELIRLGHRVLITHGNGPQVGNYLIRVEEARHLVPTLPLGIIVADTEGGMGYMIAQCLRNILHDHHQRCEIACLVTQVLVDKRDPSIKNPTKFVGPFYKKEQVPELVEKRGWIVKEDPGRGWRRVVPSPRPLAIVEREVIRLLVQNEVVVIAAGGGGVPVYVEDNGWLEGLDAVIDKDLASAVLARDVGAEEMFILTGVERVALNFGQPDQQFLDRMTVSQARQYLAEGQFPAGSMGPKIQAAINFLESGGQRVVITSIEKSIHAVYGRAGTEIVPDPT
ncbi:MAG: carbamate kinase [Calditrichaeota bacterium]|nr:MAG: carbamate kinase [Calditrichota bacterium]